MLGLLPGESQIFLRDPLRTIGARFFLDASMRRRNPSVVIVSPAPQLFIKELAVLEPPGRVFFRYLSWSRIFLHRDQERTGRYRWGRGSQIAFCLLSIRAIFYCIAYVYTSANHLVAGFRFSVAGANSSASSIVSRRIYTSLET